MNNNSKPPLPERNPITHQKHRNEVLWQITAPLVFGIAIFLLLAVLVTTGTSGDVSRWADVSLIWLILPIMVFSFIGLILLGGTAYGVIRLIQILPPYMRLAQDFMARLAIRTHKAGDSLVEPVMRYNSSRASGSALWSKIIGKEK